MHITIVGGGSTGYPLAKRLAEHHDVFVVDVDPARAERFGDLDVELVTGEGADPDVLRRAGAEGCDVFIGATRHDEINIVACSLGSRLGARRTICFVTKENFLLAHHGDGNLRRHFGIDEVVWPEAELAAGASSGSSGSRTPPTRQSSPPAAFGSWSSGSPPTRRWRGAKWRRSISPRGSSSSPRSTATRRRSRAAAPGSRPATAWC